MKKSVVLVVLLPLISQAQIRLCDTCPVPPAIDLSVSSDILHSQIERVLVDHTWMNSDEAILANMNRRADTILMSVNVPILQRFEFMAKIYRVVIDDYRSELAKAQLDARNADNSDDPTGFLHQGAKKIAGKKSTFKELIAEKQRALSRIIESRNKEMGELAEQVK